MKTDPLKKRPHFFLTHLLIFLSLSFYFSPRLLSFLVIAPDVLAFFSVIFFTLLFNLFFYYCVFNLLVILFSRVSVPIRKGVEMKDGRNEKNRKRGVESSVAILYVTKDDFMEEACLSCLQQDHSNFEVFLLDDSVTERKKSQIDRFSESFNKLNIIRRQEKGGFKAGNINHALRRLHQDFDYFVVSDSDGVLPKNFLTTLFPYFDLSETIGFVQASCTFNPKQSSSFAKDMAPQVAIHWKHFMPYHNRYGFVMFYGHSAIIKTQVWREVGGIPERVSEDLAFSYQIRERGYLGVLAEDVWTLEDAPESYLRFRKRHEKWVRGTTEFLKNNGLSLLKSSKMSWLEKMDLLSSAFSMLMSSPFVFFVLLIAFVLPSFFHAFQLSGSMFVSPIASSGKNAADYLLGFRYNMHWSFDFYLAILVGLLYPIIPAFLELWRQPKTFLNHVFVSIGVYSSLTVSSTLSVLSYLLTGRTFFPVTGEVNSDNNNPSSQTHKDLKGSFFDFRSDSWNIQLVEGMVVLIFTWVSIQSHNLWFLPVAFGSLLAIVSINTQDHKVIKPLFFFPLFIQLFLIFLIGKNILSSLL